MIVQALHQRYLDLAADPRSGVSELYFSSGKVSYVLELEPDGTLAGIIDIRDSTGKKPLPRTMIVPEQKNRANETKPYFLSDKAEYFIGYYAVSPSEAETDKKFSDAKRKFNAAKTLAREVLSDTDDAAARAVLRFYEIWDPETVRDHPLLQPYMNDLDKGIDTQMAFRLRDHSLLVHEEAAVKQAWIRYRQRQDAVSDYDAQCLITGAEGVPIARTHDKIKGVRNAQQAGASLVSFNFRSAESYGKDKQQSYNSPVGKTAVFGYTTALNHLLSSSRNRMLVGDMTVVFWSGQAAAAEEVEPFFAAFFDQNQAAAAEDSAVTAQIKDVLDRIRSGAKLEANMVPHGETPFYILGLSPNNARVSVRFFWKGDFGDMLYKLGLHAADFKLEGFEGRGDETPTAYRILAETMRVGSDGKKVGDGPPPLLGGELFRSIIQGTAYPYSLYLAIINRIRSDGIISHLRASILKAYLSRYSRIHHSDKIKEGLTMSLNPEAKEPAYRLGRLFAVLERAQQDAAGGPNRLNATIKDRYFNAASSNPAAVFPILIKLSQHHMGKSRFGDFRDREMQDILTGVESFPAHLDLHRQGLFVLGYYHQKQHFFAQMKAAADAKNEPAAEAEV